MYLYIVFIKYIQYIYSTRGIEYLQTSDEFITNIDKKRY